MIHMETKYSQQNVLSWLEAPLECIKLIFVIIKNYQGVGC